MPYGCAMRTMNGRHACWIRGMYKLLRPGQRPYVESPRIYGVRTESIGGFVPATHSQRIVGEPLGRSDGLPGQVFHLQATPVLPRRPGETMEVASEERDEWEQWVEVEHFGGSGPDDPHYLLDDVTGEIRFGPSLRDRDGRLRQYGRIPAKGRLLRFSAYRFGGGAIGNVGPNTLTVLKTSIPYIQPNTTNREAATGGTDAESLEAAKLRGPQVVRSRSVAVTAEDFERLACDASSQVARVRCLPLGDSRTPGTVSLILVPALPAPTGPVKREEMIPNDRLRREVRDYLDERRLLCVELQLEPAPCRWVSATVRVRAKRRVDRERLQHEIEQRLYRFIHPVYGGADGNGWAFGRPLHQGEIYAVVQAVPGVEYIEAVQLLLWDDQEKGQAQPCEKVEPTPNGLLCSDRHQVTVA